LFKIRGVLFIHFPRGVHLSNKKNMVIILSTVPFLMVLGNSMLIPEFPTIKAELSITQFQVGLLITFFSFPAALFIPFLGYLSDRIGRKIIIIPSLLLYGSGGIISGLAAAFLNNPYLLILTGRVVQGIGAAGTGPIAMALAGDMFKTKERSESMGILEAANGIGKVVSPIAGSAVALLAWYALFFSYALLAVPIAFLVWFFVQEPERDGEKRPFRAYLQSIGSIFDQKGVALFFNFLGGMAVLFILFGILSFISDIFETKFELHGIKRGIILAIPLFTMSVTAYLTGLYLRHKGKHYKLAYFVGLLVTGIAVGLLPFCHDHIVICPVVLGVLGIGSGLVLPAVNTMVTSATKSAQRGGVTSLYGSVRFLGVALGPPAFSLLQETGLFLMFLSTGGLVVIIGILGFLFIDEKRMIG
jgi:ACDE family multidrug resistance protein